MFTPGLAILFSGLVTCVAYKWSRVWRKSRFLEHSIGSMLVPGHWSAVTCLLLHHIALAYSRFAKVASPLILSTDHRSAFDNSTSGLTSPMR
jgi:hypothetical protein